MVAEHRQCEKDPVLLARRAYDVARSKDMDLTETGIAMNRDQFNDFIAFQHAEAEAVALWEMHRSDMQIGLHSLRLCNAPGFVLRGTDREEHSIESYEVHAVAACVDGSKYSFKMKEVSYKGCLYLTAID